MNVPNRKLATGIVLVLLVAAGCGGSGDSGSATEQATTTVSGTAASGGEAPAMYETESGIIESRTTGMADVTTVEYFTDFGRRRAQYTTTVVNIMRTSDTTHSVQIWADGYDVTYDPDTKEGKRVRLLAGVPASTPSGMPDLARMSKDQMMDMEMEEIEPREIAGRRAEGMAMTVAGMKMRAWTWNGILLRSEVDMGGSEPMVTEVTSLDLGASVPAEKFEVPADVRLTDF